MDEKQIEQMYADEEYNPSGYVGLVLILAELIAFAALYGFGYFIGWLVKNGW